MKQTHKYLSNLTPLRGIAALWVVVFHFQILVVQFVLPSQTKLLAKGYLMVDLFFIMSGFIICHVYQEGFKDGLAPGVIRRFIVARFARIYPLHFFTLIILIIAVAVLNRWSLIDDPKAIASNFLLLHSFGINKSFTWNVPSWSISSEWWAYMVFPALILFIHRGGKLAMTILGLLIVTAYLSIMYWLPRHNPANPAAPVPHDINVSFDYGFLRGLAGFISGVILYKFYEAEVWAKLFRRDIVAVILIIGTIICLHLGVNDSLYIVLIILLVYVFALNNGKLHLLCNNRIAQYLGKISYSIYLCSIFLLQLFLFGFIKLPGVKYSEHSKTTDFWTGLGYCVAFLIIHIGISSVTYYTIEKPCRKYINEKWGKETMPVYA